MAKYGSANVAFFAVDGYDLKGVSTTLADVTTAATEETHGLGDSWVEHMPAGLRSATLSAEGFYDDATDASNAALVGKETTERVVCYGYEGNTNGQQMIGHVGAYGGTYTRTAARGELTKANAEWTITGQKDDAVILHALGAETATGSATAVDQAASTAAGGAGYLQITASSGTSPTVDVKIRDSADNSTFADLITFTQATGRTAERKTVAGTINRYVQATWTHGGTSPSFTMLVGLARD